MINVDGSSIIMPAAAAGWWVHIQLFSTNVAFNAIHVSGTVLSSPTVASSATAQQ